MQLPLTHDQRVEYLALLSSPHDFDIEVDVLTLEERHVATIKRRLRADDGRLGLVDGQVNIQRSGVVKRTATLSMFDPDHSLHLDAESPFAGAVFADRLIRVRHIVELSDGQRVNVPFFVGPVVRVSRDGADLNIECQDKTALAFYGTRPYTVKKGRNAVGAIRAIMEDCTGERRFRFPRSHRARLKKAYNVGWKDEASPWAVCQKIANSIDMQLIYACDGALVLRHRPRTPVLTITAGGERAGEFGGLVGLPKVDYDATTVKNIVRVTGHAKAKKGHKQVKFTEVAVAKDRLALSPRGLARHGAPGFRPLLIDDSQIHKHSAAQQRANRELRDNLPMSAAYSVEGVPVYHLDYGDPIRVRTDFGDATIPFVEGSLPCGLGGNAVYGAQRRISKPRRR